MKQLRIVTNGVGYAVEEFREVRVGFFRTRMEWVKDGHDFYGYRVTNTYDTLKEARDRLLVLKDEWTVVE